MTTLKIKAVVAEHQWDGKNLEVTVCLSGENLEITTNPMEALIEAIKKVVEAGEERIFNAVMEMSKGTKERWSSEGEKAAINIICALTGHGPEELAGILCGDKMLHAVGDSLDIKKYLDPREDNRYAVKVVKNCLESLRAFSTVLEKAVTTAEADLNLYLKESS